MPTRSQRHLREFQGYDSNGSSPSVPPEIILPITGATPSGMATPAAGAVGRTLFTIATVVGGKAPYTMALFGNPDGLFLSVSGLTLVSIADPVGPAGAHNLTLKLTDTHGGNYNHQIVLTLT